MGIPYTVMNKTRIQTKLLALNSGCTDMPDAIMVKNVLKGNE